MNEFNTLTTPGLGWKGPFNGRRACGKKRGCNYVSRQRGCTHRNMQGSSSSRIHINRVNRSNGQESVGAEFMHEDPELAFLIESSVQLMLERVCRELKISQPNYRRLEGTIRDGIEYCRYRCLIRGPSEQNSPSCIGRYARNDDYAREDAARALLSIILASAQRNAWDYNYTRVTELEEQLMALKNEVGELKMENWYLREQIRSLNYVDNDTSTNK
ncbi:hypothetical protein SESBI_34272 [Sesbania bispinosa]|nr:hypothetical protein SESBI_34272 [Sesbania bispinosa]